MKNYKMPIIMCIVKTDDVGEKRDEKIFVVVLFVLVRTIGGHSVVTLYQ